MDLHGTLVYVEQLVVAIELIAVAILSVGTVYVLGRTVVHRLQGEPFMDLFHHTREGLGRVLLLGLEVLIAADIIQTVALELTLQSVGALGVIVLIRTFLSWAVEVETEGHWPWQRAQRRDERAAAAAAIVATRRQANGAQFAAGYPGPGADDLDTPGSS